MNSNQILSNSLVEALQDFQLAVASLLKLGKISEWNGTILKQREEKIREAALILGGKCIAILLEKLASSQEACSRALTRSSRVVAEKNEETWLKRPKNSNDWQRSSQAKIALCSGKKKP